MILPEETKALFDAREKESEIKNDLAGVEQEILDLVQQFNPGLLARKERLTKEQTEAKEKSKAAYEDLVDKLTYRANGMSMPWGKHKLSPVATVEEHTVVEANMAYAGRIAEWLVARGLFKCIEFKFSPVEIFRSAAADKTLPRDPAGTLNVLSVRQEPRVKIDSHERWNAEELFAPNVSTNEEGVVVEDFTHLFTDDGDIVVDLSKKKPFDSDIPF